MTEATEKDNSSSSSSGGHFGVVTRARSALARQAMKVTGPGPARSPLALPSGTDFSETQLKTGDFEVSNPQARSRGAKDLSALQERQTALRTANVGGPDLCMSDDDEVTLVGGRLDKPYWYYTSWNSFTFQNHGVLLGCSVPSLVPVHYWRGLGPGTSSKVDCAVMASLVSRGTWKTTYFDRGAEFAGDHNEASLWLHFLSGKRVVCKVTSTRQVDERWYIEVSVPSETLSAALHEAGARFKSKRVSELAKVIKQFGRCKAEFYSPIFEEGAVGPLQVGEEFLAKVCMFGREPIIKNRHTQLGPWVD